MKILKHSRDKTGDFQSRVLLHIPIGMLMAIPLIGNGLRDLFMDYESNEDKWTSDEAWKDLFGAMVGYVLMVAMMIIGGVILWRYYL